MADANPVAELSDYELKHLPAHLEEGLLVDDLHELLRLDWPTPEGRRNAWFSAQDKLGNLDGYLSDVRGAWRLAANTAAREVAQGGAAASIGLELRYALMVSAVNSLARNIPPSLVRALVDNELWTIPQALTYARRVPDTAQRCKALAALAPILGDPLRSEVRTEAVVAARAAQSAWFKAEAVSAIAPQLQEPLRTELLREALDERRKDGGTQTHLVLEQLAPHLGDALTQEALEIARSVTFGRASDLLALLPHLPERLREEVAEETLAELTSTEPRTRALVLAKLMRYLPAPLGARALDDLLKQVAQEKGQGREVLRKLALRLPRWALGKLVVATPLLEDEAQQALKLVPLIRCLPPPRRAEVTKMALAFVSSAEDPSDAGEVLLHLAPHLRPRSLDWAVSSLLKGKEADENDQAGRAFYLGALAPHLPDRVLRDALAVVRAIHGDNSLGERTTALEMLVPRLPEELLPEALAVASRIDDDVWQAETLVASVPYLQGPAKEAVLVKVVDAAEQLSEELGPRAARLLASAAPNLTDSLAERALAVVRTLAESGGIAVALSGLVPHLPERLVTRALGAARGVGDAHVRAEAVALVLPRLRGRAREASVQEALAIVRTLRRELLGKPLAALAPYLSNADKRQLIAAALSKPRPHPTLAPSDTMRKGLSVLDRALDRSEETQAAALEMLAPHLPENMLGESVAIASELVAHLRTKALLALVPRLRDPLRTHALQLAVGSLHQQGLTIASASELSDLLAILEGEERSALLREALDLVRNSSERAARVEILPIVARYVNEPLRTALLDEAVVEARQVDSVARQDALQGLAAELAATPRPWLVQRWQQLLPRLTSRAREDLLSDLAQLAPVIAHLGGGSAVEALTGGVVDVGLWWP
jgi:hypothetical protein